MHIINTTALISINETMIIQLVSFLVFMFLINRIMFRPLQQTMRDREGYVDRLIKEIDDVEKDIIDQKEQMKAKQATVRQEAFKVSEAMEDSGQKEATAIFDEAQAEIADINAQTAATVKAQIVAARSHLEEEAKSLSQAILEKVLDRRIAA
jgi:F-type H+-transporting ATPase subunit b